jgi:hypothetical protein
VCDLSLAQGWFVMDGPYFFMGDPTVRFMYET